MTNAHKKTEKRTAGPRLQERSTSSYYAEVNAPSLNAQVATIEQLIEFAFDDLHAQHLELRVVDPRRNNTCTSFCN